MVLRDLAVRLGQLSIADLKRARSLLARPTDGPSDPLGDGYTVAAQDTCTVDSGYDSHFCIHWVASTADAVSSTDVCTEEDASVSPPTCLTTPGNSIPDYVDVLKSVLDNVWDTETGTGPEQFGFKVPKDDAASPNTAGGNPNGKVDIFLKALQPAGLYGYCTSDDPNLSDPGYPYWDMSAYCVLDNSYLGYGYSDFTIAMKVTAAHEFFHASQFAYDLAEDVWFMEGTATWMEDQVYDNLSGNNTYDDNYAYLPYGPLASPQTSLDNADGAGGFWVYGSWIFWRFLSERYGAGGVQSQAIVKEVWDRANAGSGGPDDYSTQALNNVLVAHGSSFRTAFATFGQWLAIPAKKFSEGAYYTPTTAITKTFTLRGVRSATPTNSVRLNHMAERLWVFKPGAKVKKTAKLTVEVNGPSGATAEASALTVMKSGAVRYTRLTLSSAGNGSVRLAFGRGKVSRVILIIGNAGIDFSSCWSSTVFSCAGVSGSDGLVTKFSASQR